MATITPTITYLSRSTEDGQNGSNVLVQWAGITEADTGEAVEFTALPDRSVQFKGGWGTSGAVVVEGSNDSTNYVTLTDPQGNNISKTADAVEQVAEVTRKVRPRATAGTGVSVTVSMLFCGVRRA